MSFAKFHSWRINRVFDMEVWKIKNFSYSPLITSILLFMAIRPQKEQLHCFRHILFLFYTFQCIRVLGLFQSNTVWNAIRQVFFFAKFHNSGTKITDVRLLDYRPLSVHYKIKSCPEKQNCFWGLSPIPL